MTDKQYHNTMKTQHLKADSCAENPQEAQYRRACRKFYHKSTSFVSDSDDDSTNETNENENRARNDHGALKDHHKAAEAALLLEAIDHLAEGGPQSYKRYLSEQKKKLNGSYSTFEELLELCGLPTSFKEEKTNERDLSDPAKLQRWMAIRNEERRSAHERNIRRRKEQVLQFLKEYYRSNPQKAVSVTSCTEKSTISITTRADLVCIQQTMQSFVKKYAIDDCVAAHPLIAGMRKLIEQQLEATPSNENDEAVCLLWIFDAAVISEAVVANEQGANDGYVRDAISALTSFLVWIPNKDVKGDDEIVDNDNTTNDISASWTFAVQPSLSDRTLEMLLRILPSFKELHGRPTGSISAPQVENGGDLDNVSTNTAKLVRNNVDGEHDELDLCTAWFHNAMRLFS